MIRNKLIKLFYTIDNSNLLNNSKNSIQYGISVIIHKCFPSLVFSVLILITEANKLNYYQFARLKFVLFWNSYSSFIHPDHFEDPMTSPVMFQLIPFKDCLKLHLKLIINKIK